MDVLPSKLGLLAACRGESGMDHLLLRSANELVGLHELRLSADRDRIDEIDEIRRDVVCRIDRWLDDRLPPSRGGAHIHTETVGAVIDRLAGFLAAAYATLSGTQPYWELCDAWEKVAELACAYEDLAAEVAVGVRRLPGGR